jgi:hypothetical protein
MKELPTTTFKWGKASEPFGATITHHHMPPNTVVCRGCGPGSIRVAISAREVHAHKIHAYRVHAHKVGMPIKCLPMRCPLRRCTPGRCTLLKYIPVTSTLIGYAYMGYMLVRWTLLRYKPVRYIPMECTTMACTPVRYTPVSTCLEDARLKLLSKFPKVYLKLEPIVHDKPLGPAGCWVAYGGMLWWPRMVPGRPHRR